MWSHSSSRKQMLSEKIFSRTLLHHIMYRTLKTIWIKWVSIMIVWWSGWLVLPTRWERFILEIYQGMWTHDDTVFSFFIQHTFLYKLWSFYVIRLNRFPHKAFLKKMVARHPKGIISKTYQRVGGWTFLYGRS